MRIFSFLVLFFLVAPGLQAQQKKFSCKPCDHDCDGKITLAPGKCEACGMEMVDVSTIKFKTLTFAQLCQRLHTAKNIVLIDVRSPEEFTNTQQDRDSYGKFKNAININVTELPARVAELNKFKDKEVIVYCSHSHRSPEASYFLSTHGFKNVSNVAGGVSILATDPALKCLRNEYIPFDK